MLESRWLACKRPTPMLRYGAERAGPRKLRLFVCACCRRLWPWLRVEASRQAVEELERQADARGRLTPTQAVRQLAKRGVSAAIEQHDASGIARQEAEARRARVWGSIWVGDPPAPSFLVRSAAELEEAQTLDLEAEAGVQGSELIASVAEERIDSIAVAAEAMRVVVLGRTAAETRVRAVRWALRAEEEADRPVPRARAALRAAQAAQWIERQEESTRNRGMRQDEKRQSRERRAQCALIRDLFGNPFRPIAIEPDWLEWNDGCAVKLAQTIYDERKYQDMAILADALEEAGCADRNILDHCRQPSEHARGCWVLDSLLGHSV